MLFGGIRTVRRVPQRLGDNERSEEEPYSRPFTGCEPCNIQAEGMIHNPKEGVRYQLLYMKMVENHPYPIIDYLVNII